ncbi:hypothetical protein [Candidatus Viridilinea mediisalina]|uniref:Uncharacterized protein n=1 Tax=Candidatus Viridilinea mediisalina TaxID=2024553 RepID=A0A2A6RQ44_9CHLR|nr:hypothetical protein [Candidatus Viridilinea mediisalina]PDW05008.1 hypothetical protein CJ255_01025 [Candidatus Viridilinea mediisalina]
MKAYRLSPAGQRLTLILLVAALLIWAFALWSFASTLRISYHPLQFWPSLQQSLAAGLGVGQVVPALLMLCLIVATPLLIWSLLEEWAGCYTPTTDGLRFTSLLGISLLYPWSSISAIRRADDDADEPLDELIFNTDQSSQIQQPLLRFLHRQAFGGTRLPIYAGLEDRDALLDEIRQRLES